MFRRIYFEGEEGGSAPAGGGGGGESAASVTTASDGGGAPAVNPVSAPEPVLTVPEPSTTPKEEPFAKKFAALSHKEREVRQRQQDLQRRESEIKAKEEAITGHKPKSALEALKAAGFSYQEATTEALGIKVETPKDPVEERFSQYEQKLQTVEELKTELRRLQDNLAAEKQQNLRTQVHNAIASTVQQSADKYELIGQHGDQGIETVFHVMEEHYNKSGGETLSFAAACDLVENYYESYAKKLSAAKKFQAKATPTAASSKPASKPAGTLTNADSSGSSKQLSDAEFNKLPKDEQLKRVAQQIKFLEG